MPTKKHAAHPGLLDIARMEDAAESAGRSAEALFGYLSRLDALRDAASDIGRAALADRAANAELHMRVLINSGLQAFNELQDLGLIDRSLHAAIKDPDTFNKVKLTDALEQIGAAFKERIPNGRWDWLAKTAHLVADVELRVEVHGAHLHGIVTHSGQSTVVPLIPGGRPRTRVTSSAFFSAGSDRSTRRRRPSSWRRTRRLRRGWLMMPRWAEWRSPASGSTGTPVMLPSSAPRRAAAAGLSSRLSSSFLSSSRRSHPSRPQSSNSLARAAAPKPVSGRPIWGLRLAFCRARRIGSTPIRARRGFSPTAPTRNDPAGMGAAA